MAQIDRSNLTEEEIKALSLELKCCYYLMPWNHGLNPQNIGQWASGIGFLSSNEQEHSDAIVDAVDAVARLIDFVQEYFVEKDL